MPKSDNGADTSLMIKVSESQRQLEETTKERLIADKRAAYNAKFEIANITRALLQVMDSLDRALQSAPSGTGTGNETVKTLALNVAVAQKLLLHILEQQGVRKMNALGKAFNTMFHFAIEQRENVNVPAGTIVELLQEGYIMDDRVLRTAMVTVARGGPKVAPTTDRKN